MAAAGFREWREIQIAGLTDAKRVEFDAQSDLMKYTAYRNWLSDSKIASMRQALATMKADCDTAMQLWRQEVDGATVVVRLCPDGPPVELLELSVVPRELSLPWTNATSARSAQP